MNSDFPTRVKRWLRTRNPLVDHRQPKVFGLGFNKTGTSSLHQLLLDLGYQSFHGPAWRRWNTSILHTYDAFTDGFPPNWQELDARFPNSKFILHVRDLHPWVTSRIDHILRLEPHERKPPHWVATEDAVEGWIRSRNAHHRKVLKFFEGRDQDLIVVNLIRDPKAAQRVARFLGSGAAVAFPHRNKNPRPRSEEAEELFSAVADHLGLSDAERLGDLYCPSLDGGGLPVNVAEWTGSRGESAGTSAG